MYDLATIHRLEREALVRSGLACLWPEDRPQPGKVYRLTGGSKDKAISNGNTWNESEVKRVRHDENHNQIYWGLARDLPGDHWSTDCGRTDRDWPSRG